MLRTSRAAALVSFAAWLVAALAVPAVAQGQSAPKYSAKVPPSITTPDTVQTRFGTPKFPTAYRDAETVQKVCDNLDFERGVEPFPAGIPATSSW